MSEPLQVILVNDEVQVRQAQEHQFEIVNNAGLPIQVVAIGLPLPDNARQEAGGHGSSAANPTFVFGTINAVFGGKLSDIPGRTPVMITLDNLSVQTDLWTVTAGSSLYLVGYDLTYYNDRYNVLGRFAITDNGEVKVPKIISPRFTGSISAGWANMANLPEPIKFTTNVRLDFLAGSCFVSGILICYEEINL